MSYLVLEGISKKFRHVEVLRDIRLNVEEGEFICLLGPSGSGKSTILRLIGGFETPDTGTIQLAGRVIQDLPPNRRDIGFVFQDYALFPHMTVEENVRFGLVYRKMSKEEIRERVQSVLQLVGLVGMEKRYPRQLSGGQQQRVAIARAIALRPTLLLLDEPLSNLDAKLRRQIRLEMRQLQRELGITTVMVTHDQEEAMTMSDRIAILQNGMIQQFGTPLELYREPVNLFVAGFVGDPPINLQPCKVEVVDGRAELPVWGTRFRLESTDGSSLADGRELVIGIRPENLTITDVDKAGGSVIAVTVDAVEHLGGSALVHVRTVDDNRLCAVVHAQAVPPAGKRIGLNIHADEALLFDGKTTDRLPGLTLKESRPPVLA